MSFLYVVLVLTLYLGVPWSPWLLFVQIIWTPGFYWRETQLVLETCLLFAHSFGLRLLSTGNRVTVPQNAATRLITGARKWASISTRWSLSSACQLTSAVCSKFEFRNFTLHDLDLCHVFEIWETRLLLEDRDYVFIRIWDIISSVVWKDINRTSVGGAESCAAQRCWCLWVLCNELSWYGLHQLHADHQQRYIAYVVLKLSAVTVVKMICHHELGMYIQRSEKLSLNSHFCSVTSLIPALEYYCVQLFYYSCTCNQVTTLTMFI